MRTKKSMLKRAIVISIVVSVFFVGYFLGSINYDLNPRVKEVKYTVQVFDTELPDNLSVEIDYDSPITKDSVIWIDVTGLSRSVTYHVSKVAFIEVTNSIDGYSIEFVNATSFSIPMNAEKTNVICWGITNTSWSYLFEVWVHEEITFIDLINAIPVYADISLLPTLVGFVIGAIVSLFYFMIGDSIKRPIKVKIKETIKKIRNNKKW